MSHPYTKRERYTLPNNRNLLFYEAVDSHGTGTQNYTVYAADGSVVKLYCETHKHMPQELKDIIKEAIPC